MAVTPNGKTISGGTHHKKISKPAPDGFVLRERAPGVSVAEIRAATAGKLVVPGPDEDVPEMALA